MLAVLVAIRDFLLAAALAWVGVTMETRGGGEQSCAGEACQTQRDN
jgi:hypothetical protein